MCPWSSSSVSSYSALPSLGPRIHSALASVLSSETTKSWSSCVEPWALRVHSIRVASVLLVCVAGGLGFGGEWEAADLGKSAVGFKARGEITQRKSAWRSERWRGGAAMAPADGDFRPSCRGVAPGCRNRVALSMNCGSCAKRNLDTKDVERRKVLLKSIP